MLPNERAGIDIIRAIRGDQQASHLGYEDKWGNWAEVAAMDSPLYSVTLLTALVAKLMPIRLGMSTGPRAD